MRVMRRLVFSPNSLRTQSALIYDGVIILAESLKELGIDNVRPKKILCNKIDVTWEKGNSISNFMRNVKIYINLIIHLSVIKFAKNFVIDYG